MSGSIARIDRTGQAVASRLAPKELDQAAAPVTIGAVIDAARGDNHPAVDAQLARARIETNPPTHKDLYNQRQVIAAGDMPIAPLWNQQCISAAHDDVQGLPPANCRRANIRDGT